MKALSVLAALAILFVSPFAYGADDERARYDRACEAYNHGAYFTAFQDLLPFAARGDAQAQFAIGEMLRTGRGTARNREEALVWYRRAAEQGHGAAQCNLGTSLFNGWGAAPDPQKAIDWWLQAAANKNARAMFNLGTVIARGRHVKRDFVRAFWWLTQASTHGYAGADDVLKTLRKVMSPADIARADRMVFDRAVEFERKRFANPTPRRRS